MQGYSEWRSLAVAQAVCRPGDCIIEIGDHLGVETLSFADIVGRSGQVIAFEPVPELREVIIRNRDRNQQQHISVLPYAVAEAARTVQFQKPSSPHNTGTGKISRDPHEQSETFAVPCVTLDQLSRSLPAPRFMHIDAEGAEPLILQGAQHLIARHRPTIFLEVFPRLLKEFDTTPAALRTTLQQMGYHVFMLRLLLGRQSVPINTHLLINWIAVPVEQPALLRRITAYVHLAGWLPLGSSVNPLCSPTHWNRI
ncbi:MAG: FkbM family methyltransferase [Chloroflexaceae bacterium]|nr:FkbM family methyltransferase [Chloroflexaceae bacterium]